MLILGRSEGQRIIIKTVPPIVLTLMSSSHGHARIGLETDRAVKIVREELEPEGTVAAILDAINKPKE